MATGETPTAREFPDIAFGQLDLNPDDHVEIDPKYYRPTEVNLLHGDSSKGQSQLSWQVKTDLETLVSLMVQSDVDAVSGTIDC